MNPFIVALAPYVGIAAALAVLYAVVMVIMAGIDRKRRDGQRERKRERDYWRTTKADPRRARRTTRNWPPRGGFAA